MRTRYKLARLCHGRYLSANQCADYPSGTECLEYKVGQVTTCDNKRGVACYKTLKHCDQPRHIEETRDSFNNGNSIVILKLKPVGKPVRASRHRYKKGSCYEGGINYKAVEVSEVVRTIMKESTK